VQPPAQVIAGQLLDRAADFSFTLTLTRQEYRCRCPLCTFDSFRMIVRNLGGPLSFRKHFFQRFKRPTDWPDPHALTVPQAVIGLRTSRLRPVTKSQAVAGTQVVPVVFLKRRSVWLVV